MSSQAANCPEDRLAFWVTAAAFFMGAAIPAFLALALLIALAIPAPLWPGVFGAASALAGVVAAAATVAAVVYARLGVRAWWRQFQGSEAHKLARRVLGANSAFQVGASQALLLVSSMEKARQAKQVAQDDTVPWAVQAKQISELHLRRRLELVESAFIEAAAFWGEKHPTTKVLMAYRDCCYGFASHFMFIVSVPGWEDKVPEADSNLGLLLKNMDSDEKGYEALESKFLETKKEMVRYMHEMPSDLL